MEHGLDIEGSDLDGVMGCMQFLHEVNIGKMPDREKQDRHGHRRRQCGYGPGPGRHPHGCRQGPVIINYRRGRKEMPAHDWEIEGAEEEGVEFMLMSAPKRFIGKDGKLVAVECISMELGEPDESGRRRPIPIKGSEKVIPIDMAILSIGLLPSTADFPAEMKNEQRSSDRGSTDPSDVRSGYFCLRGLRHGHPR